MNRRLLVALSSGLLSLLVASVAHAGDRLFVLSIPDVPVAQGERVAGISLRMKEASLHASREIPIGWTWTVGNHGSLITEVDGIAEVGAAGLDAAFVDDLFVIERADLAGLSFSVELVLRVTTDFSVTRDVILRQPQLVLEPR